MGYAVGIERRHRDPARGTRTREPCPLRTKSLLDPTLLDGLLDVPGGYSNLCVLVGECGSPTVSIRLLAVALSLQPEAFALGFIGRTV